jgi:hypothetical protein
MIIEVHRKVDNNIGDLYCNPSRYFDLGVVSQEELLNNNSNLLNHTLVIGGGGLIHKKFNQHIENLINKNPKKIVIWGIGHNFGKRYVEKSIENVYYPSWLKKCNLVGIRDYIKDYYDIYLPCVTCMHPAFNKTYDLKYDTVYFSHAYKSKIKDTESKIHMKNNNMNFNDVISFLGSANTVVTDSYHGVYWAQLLGKNVHAASWSVKFNHMKHLPNFLENINDKIIPIKNSIDGFLEECQFLNKEFYHKFKNL